MKYCSRQEIPPIYPVRLPGTVNRKRDDLLLQGVIRSHLALCIPWMAPPSGLLGDQLGQVWV